MIYKGFTNLSQKLGQSRSTHSDQTHMFDLGHVTVFPGRPAVKSGCPDAPLMKHICLISQSQPGSRETLVFDLSMPTGIV